MRRRAIRPFGQSTSAMRMASMVMALFVLWAVYARLKDAATWRVFLDKPTTAAEIRPQAEDATESEDLIPGPNDLDAEEVETAAKLFEFVTDRAPLKSREMDAYWRMMDWSLTEPFDELAVRAKSNVLFTQLWEQPDLYRGKPIRLKLHVRRVVQWDAPKDQPNIEKVYEAWGWTDESRSFPYLVVFSGSPHNLPIGDDIRAEIDFVGYFLKVMTYTAFDHNRGTPLLIGRARLISTSTPPAAIVWDRWSIGLTIAASLVILAIAFWIGRRPRRKPTLSMLPKEFSAIEPVIGSAANESPAQNDSGFPKF